MSECWIIHSPISGGVLRTHVTSQTPALGASVFSIGTLAIPDRRPWISAICYSKSWLYVFCPGSRVYRYMYCMYYNYRLRSPRHRESPMGKANSTFLDLATVFKLLGPSGTPHMTGNLVYIWWCVLHRRSIPTSYISTYLLWCGAYTMYGLGGENRTCVGVESYRKD